MSTCSQELYRAAGEGHPRARGSSRRRGPGAAGWGDLYPRGKVCAGKKEIRVVLRDTTA